MNIKDEMVLEIGAKKIDVSASINTIFCSGFLRDGYWGIDQQSSYDMTAEELKNADFMPDILTIVNVGKRTCMLTAQYCDSLKRYTTACEGSDGYDELRATLLLELSTAEREQYREIIDDEAAPALDEFLGAFALAELKQYRKGALDEYTIK